MLLMLAGMNGVILAGDLFNLFVFLEVAAVASYALVAFGTERHELEAAFKYAVMGTVGSLFILLGIVLLYSVTSTLNMADMGMQLAEQKDHNLILMVSVLFLMGFGLKAALVPFHAWLPDAHPSAPAPISAMLSGVLIKSLGIYALGRIFFNVIGLTPMVSSILMLLGTLSMVVGVLLAIGQRDLKRLLAYSSISQIGYVVLGIGLGTPLGILGGLLHLFNHSVFKALLFLNSGALEYATGTRDLQMMGGLGKKMPVTYTTGFVASMSIVGMPPFSGFWSKLLIIIAAVEAGHLGYALWAVIVSVATLALFAKVIKNAFLGELSPRLHEVREVPGFMQVSMIALALICLVSGTLLIPGLKDIFLNQATAIFVQGSNYAKVILGSI
jgi:multicomponent Na+:H+ antiporter subunit D